MSTDAPLHFDDEYRIAKDEAAREMTINAKVRLYASSAPWLFCSSFFWNCSLFSVTFVGFESGIHDV
jgi:hypothetical protein